ncbi:MAG: hypothetical protein GOVbin4296_20 [Prokaryotic dsDNA virus sp.]|nr:MAG: hypothetical protein GOVbin4296_20 [Prokaryotic dsDNA virus sp.]|tara:strand:- start:8933 stop:10711 length:1779 start_codon:yes stop_codon:yes gene_type:complete
MNEIMQIDEFNPNIEEVANNIFLGPQAEILEELERFNSRWGTNVKLTKKFYWSPGTYNTIKTSYANEGLRFKMKPSGMYSIFDRMSSYSYSANNFKRDILKIEDMRNHLTRQNIVMTDNTEQIEDAFDSIKSRMNEISSIDNVSVTINPIYNEDTGAPSYRRFTWNIVIDLPEGHFSLFNQDQLIGEIPRHKVQLLFSVNMFKHLNNFISGCNPAFRDGYYSRGNKMDIYGYYFGTRYFKQHPYISRRYRSPYERTNANNEENILTNYNVRNQICLGDLGKQIQTHIYKLELEEALTMLNIWNSIYRVPSTNPLNNIRDTFVGKPSIFPTEMYDVIGRHERCQIVSGLREADDRTVIEDYSHVQQICDNDKCENRGNCTIYQILSVKYSESEISKIFQDFLTHKGFTDSDIRVYFQSQLHEGLDDQTIGEYYDTMINLHIEWDSLYDRLSNEDKADSLYTFVNCYLNSNVFDGLRELANEDPEERKKASQKAKEDRILAQMAANGQTAQPINVNRTSMERAADAEDPNYELRDNGEYTSESYDDRDDHPHNRRNDHLPEITEEEQAEAENVSEETIMQQWEEPDDEPFLNNS